jgi:hypothetical protein
MPEVGAEAIRGKSNRCGRALANGAVMERTLLLELMRKVITAGIHKLGQGFGLPLSYSYWFATPEERAKAIAEVPHVEQ